jgi:nicotinamidase-related amidase
MKQNAVIIIDMQKAYFNSPELQQRQAQLTEACNRLIAYAAEHEIPIFNVRTRHERNKATWTINMLEDGRGFLFDGDEDYELVDGLDLGQAIDATEVIKTRDSAFFDTNLASMLRVLGVRRLILCGVSTHSCVLQTAADAYAANFKISLAVEAIASHVPELHEPALRILRDEYRQTDFKQTTG